MKDFLWRWFVLSLAVFIASNIRFLGISYESWNALLVAALLLGVANTVVKPILMLISLPVIVLSFGIFILIINALLFYAVGYLVEGFHIGSFWSALGGSITVSLISLLLGRRPRLAASYSCGYPPRPPPPGKGPIIDV